MKIFLFVDGECCNNIQSKHLTGPELSHFSLHNRIETENQSKEYSFVLHPDDLTQKFPSNPDPPTTNEYYSHPTLKL